MNQHQRLDRELESERNEKWIRGIRSMRFVKFRSAGSFYSNKVWFTNIFTFFLLPLQFSTWRLGKRQCKYRQTARASRRRPSTGLPHHSSPPRRARWRSPSASHGGTSTFSSPTWCSWFVWISESRAAVSEIECDFIMFGWHVNYFRGIKRIVLRWGKRWGPLQACDATKKREAKQQKKWEKLSPPKFAVVQLKGSHAN